MEPLLPPGHGYAERDDSGYLAAGSSVVGMLAYAAHFRVESGAATSMLWLAAAVVAAGALAALAGKAAWGLPPAVRWQIGAGLVLGLLLGSAGFATAEHIGDPASDLWLPLLSVVGPLGMAASVTAAQGTAIRLAACLCVAVATLLMVGPALL